jgi:ribonuclease P protein component
VLPRRARMRSSVDFRGTTRGIREGRGTLVVHARRSSYVRVDHPTPSTSPVPTGGVRVGFVVARSVGNAVTRNRVRRRLQHLAAAQLEQTPPGTDLVVRALPRAASDPHSVPDDLRSAWLAALTRLAATPGGGR